jgi:serpin B
MMKNTKAKYLYQMHADFELIDLPYGNEQYRMTVLMPKAGRNFDSFLDTWTMATLNNHLQNAPEIGYDLYFPKMKMESELNLKPTLAHMGLEAAFDMSKGGFSAFFHDDGEFIITDVKQKTFLEVDEKGTEAAAVTAIGVGVTSLPPSVRVNRPFYFFIREQHTDALLFMGRCMNPLEM